MDIPSGKHHPQHKFGREKQKDEREKQEGKGERGEDILAEGKLIQEQFGRIDALLQHLETKNENQAHTHEVKELEPHIVRCAKRERSSEREGREGTKQHDMRE